MQNIKAVDFLKLQSASLSEAVQVRVDLKPEGALLENSFLTTGQAIQLRKFYGTPVYVYSEARLLEQAEQALSMPSAFGHTARFALKACPNKSVVACLHGAGLKIDASSGYEAMRCIAQGIPASDIKLTSQELPGNLKELIIAGVNFNACSLTQLTVYGQLFPGGNVSVRFNPGLGSGHNNRTNVGGPASSFGIWHEEAPAVKAIAAKYNLHITGLHSHIGAGADPAVWVRCADLTLALVQQFPEVTTVNLGGGFKIARMPEEQTADLQSIGEAVKEKFLRFKAEDPGSRALQLEIEPGTFLTATAGAVVATVIDIKSTGAGGYTFLLVDTGMTEVLRPSIYGAQHPLYIVSESERECPLKEYLVAGHCCESGDILTPAPGDPEGLLLRNLPETFIGDILVVGGTGAYCSAMTTANYNSFPKAPEVLLTKSHQARLIRRREKPEEVYSLEL